MSKLSKKDVTPLELYQNRRLFLKASIYSLSGLASFGAYRYFRGLPSTEAPADLALAQDFNLGPRDSATPYSKITNYNNYYEFSTDKEAVAHEAKSWNIADWNLSIEGLVEKPFAFNLKQLSELKTEERIYRFRCVEGWSMVIPWLGVPLSSLLEKARPLSSARYVAFETYYNPQEMPNARASGLDFPYVEGLRLDEALHPLTLLSTGLYGKNLPNQNGAPVRLVVPWKYGFKSIKSLVKIRLTEERPDTTWNLAIPNEYGFYSNVNPHVDHPRWSQAKERRIGEYQLRPTLMFNGYEKEVSSLYAGLDLTENF